MSDDRPVVVDLFCGAGGMSLGLAEAGFRPAAAYDSWAPAVASYNSNIAGHVEQVALEIDSAILPATVIAGGPPCQGFSSAGMRRSGDSRNSLVSVYAGIIAKVLPEAFVFENVEGFLTAEDGVHVLELLEPLVAAGYRIHLRKVNAANFGVPQHRKRVIAIGGLGWDPSFPTPTHTAFGAPGALLASRNLPRTPTLADALAGLPAASTIPPGEPSGHFYRVLEGEDSARATALEPGQTMRDLPEDMHHLSYRRRAFRRVMDGTPTARRGGAPAGVRRLKGDEPSKAITGGARSEFLHPIEHRNLTLRECARLQTFPDSFAFQGSISEQAQLIGNAVPPRLASEIGKSVLADLARSHTGRLDGALLSFVPTMSDGYSPVLRKVTETVRRRFRLQQPEEALSLWD